MQQVNRGMCVMFVNRKARSLRADVVVLLLNERNGMECDQIGEGLEKYQHSAVVRL